MNETIIANSTSKNFLGLLYNLSFADALSEVKILVLLIIGMVIYAFFIYKFYNFIAQKDILNLNLSEKGETTKKWLSIFLKKLFYVIENLFLIPIFILFWFIVLTALLLFLSKNNSIDTIMMISMSLIGSIRVTAFFNEDLAKELSKLIPFVLLGIFLVDISFFAIDSIFEKLNQFPMIFNKTLYYFLFIVFLEFLLRIGYMLFNPKDKFV